MLAAHRMSAALVALPWLVGARLGMTATELTEANFDEFANQHDRLIVDFYDPNDSEWLQNQKDLEQALVTVRKAANSRVPFAKVDVSKESALATRFVLNGIYPQLIWFAHGKPTQYHRTLRQADQIANFVLALDRPSVTQIESVNATADYNMAVIAEISKNSPLYKTIDAVALRHMDQVAFLHMQSNKGTISYYKDGLMVQQYEEHIMHEGQHEVDALDKWLKHQLPFKSEEAPEGKLAMDDGVHVVVGKNFEDVVLQKDKDVMLLVHAPWCGHCKTLRPKWKQLSQAVSSMSHLVMAQMDGDRNQSPLPNDFEWHAYPTIFYVRAGETLPAVYRGNRTVESLLDFAKGHSSKPFGISSQNMTDAIYDL